MARPFVRMTGVSEAARRLHVHGVVQGVGFRPFVWNLARSHSLSGWVVNTGAGVEIHVEGAPPELAAFERGLRTDAPAAARITDLLVHSATRSGCVGFEIRPSADSAQPTVDVPVDLATCDRCVLELLSPGERRFGYPYVSCSTCGPRFTILRSLPYDRSVTTMAEWPLCADCAREYHDPSDRRFHAQPIACPKCGPGYRLIAEGETPVQADSVFEATARLLSAGHIVGMKGLGGYHLACAAADAAAVRRLRALKHRDEKPFAVMTRDLAAARALVELRPEEEDLLASPARPIVIARARRTLKGVAPGRDDLGVMLPYTPAQHLLFHHGTPDPLVMTSGNRSDEPIAYQDSDAIERLHGIADVILVGTRAIARRVDDSVTRVGALGPVVLRRSRGYAPGMVATIPAGPPVLAVGGDLKSAVTLAVGGKAFTSQHLGDLDHVAAREAFDEAIRDLIGMYRIDPGELVLAHDLHPEYASTRLALELPARARCAVQHHRAHIASVLAERGAYDTRVIGIACDGTGYGDDGGIWGGEFFAGTMRGGLERVGHLRPAPLPGGDAASRHPVQAAAGLLAEVNDLPDLEAPPFAFPRRYRDARRLIEQGLRTWRTTSVGRLFDAVAALLGFTRPVSYEGQAAMWLEQLARTAPSEEAPPIPFADGQLDFRDTLRRVAWDRRAGVDPARIARSFHRALAGGLAGAAQRLGEEHGASTIVISGGVFQNDCLVRDLADSMRVAGMELWTNQRVPPNDGGLSLGQAAIAAMAMAAS